jgi:manganese transport protein
VAALIIIGLNFKVVYKEIRDLILGASHPMLVSFTVVPLCLFCVFMLVYVFVIPLMIKGKIARTSIHKEPQPLKLNQEKAFNRIAVTVDFSDSDHKAISRAVQLGNAGSTLVLIHVLESANAVVYGENAFDLEREEDFQKLKKYQEELQARKILTEIQLGFGSPKQAIPDLVSKNNCDMLVMGTHGHTTFYDILLGTTVESVRHKIIVPLVLV